MIFHRFYKGCRHTGILFFYILSLVPLIIFSGCGTYEYITHTVTPADRYMRDVYSIRAVRRTSALTVGAEKLDDAQLRGILHTPPFSKNLIAVNAGERYLIDVFVLTVTNVSEKPVCVGTPRVCYGEHTQKAYTGNDLRENLQYTPLNPLAERGTFWYRMTTREKRFDHLKTESLTVYEFDTIIPGDTVLTLVFTDAIPVEYRTFSLCVPVTSESRKKTVTLNFSRHEERIQKH